MTESRQSAGDLGKRLCELHERLSRCFEGATGETPPRRPRYFEPLFADLDTILDAAAALSNESAVAKPDAPVQP